MGGNALSSRVVLRLILDKNREQVECAPDPSQIRVRAGRARRRLEVVL